MEIKPKNSKVLSFEPQRMIFYAIAGALALNDLDNCFVYNLGLSDREGQAELPQVDYSKPSDFGTVSVKDKDAASPDNAGLLHDSLVKMITLDSLNLPRLDFFKLDIEGHELLALSGAINTIEKFRPFLWIEYFIIGKDPIKEALQDMKDYDYFIMDYQNMLCAPKEKMRDMGIIIKKS